MKNSTRIKWLDVSRGIAFLMVIYSHIDFHNPMLMRYFSPVFLTTFFFVSGYLFKTGHSFSYVFEQRTRTLLLPFFILGFIMICMGQILTFHPKLTLADAVKGLLLQNWNNQILWFIAALYVYSIIFFWIDKWTSNSKKLILVLFLLFILNSIYVRVIGVIIPWHIETFGFACFYMGLGKWYKENEIVVDKYIINKYSALVCIILYISLITVFNLHVSFDGSEYIVDALLVTILGIVIMLYISKNVFKHSKFLLFVGANTLFILLFILKLLLYCK